MLSELANGSTDTLSECRDGNLERRLQSRILSALRSAGYAELWSVRCQVGEGVVVLSGVLPSYHLKQVAQHAILELNDPRVVQNLIEVRT